MAESARIAIVGGGIAGCSLAYHLTLLGERDVVLLEQYDLTQGTTWHAAGLCTQFSGSLNLMALLQRSVELYGNLGAETGLPVPYHGCGSLRLARDRDRLDEFRHVQGVADQVGVPFEIVSGERAGALHPLIVTDDLLGAAYLATDGWIDPSTVTRALAKGAAAREARILRETPVTGVERTPAGWRLETPKGPVTAQTVVCAAGMWSPEVARLAGADLPIVPVQHQYVLTEPVEALSAAPGELPVLRDPGASFYARQDNDSLLVGPFEADARIWAPGRIPNGFRSRLLRPDPGRIAGALERAVARLPVLGDVGVRPPVNGPDGYTPDGRCLMGLVPGLRDFWVLAGFSIFGIVFSGGAGGYAAEWILDGQPSDTMWELDVRRFDRNSCSRTYVHARAAEVYRREYDVHFPEEERPAGRPLLTGPLYDRLAERGAVYGVRSGWERPLWFAPSGAAAHDVYSFRRGNWHETVGTECRAVRAAVGVLDQTSFAKLEVSGHGAEGLLDRLCTNALPAEPGRITLTQLCTPRGGIEADLTITRLGDDRFYLVSAAATGEHDWDWIARHAPEDGSVRLENRTAALGVLTIAGPRSRELLEAVTPDDVSRAAFPFFRCRELEIGMARVRALRLSFVGELGYELHHPVELQRHLYDRLCEAGEALGLVDFGYRALESLRLEKAYRLWGADMSADWTPLEAGLERFVRFDKGDFVGRDALLAQRERGVDRSLACLVIDPGPADAHGFEPVYADRTLVGYVASGGYGHTVDASIAFSYLPVELTQPGTELEVEILHDRRPARVVAQPLYDPDNERLRA